MECQIREMQKGDWRQVSEIYQQGMDTNLATFQTQCPTYEEFDQSHMKQCRFVITNGDAIAGWAVLTPASSRCVYRGVAEVSIYIHDAYRGRGAGSQLLNFLSVQSEKEGIWTLQSGISQVIWVLYRLKRKPSAPVLEHSLRGKCDIIVSCSARHLRGKTKKVPEIRDFLCSVRQAYIWQRTHILIENHRGCKSADIGGCKVLFLGWFPFDR